MKKIALITLHNQSNNFGSVLQSYALYTYVEKQGYDIEIIDYHPYYSNGSRSFIEKAKRFCINLFFLLPYIIRRKRFNAFIRKQRLSERYFTYNSLKMHPPVADIYLVGSDQVWNKNYLCGRDPAYYLEFTNSPNKMSYAASLGQIITDNTELNGVIKRISKFRYIYLREEDSVTQLRNAGLINVECVLDPVFLLPIDHYKGLQVPINESGYILAYIIHNDPFIAQVVSIISKKMGKIVIQVGGFAPKCHYNKFFRDVGPREFLSLVDNADFIITSSFHGVAFSHIYKKQFAVVMPYTNALRIENILKIAGTTDRVVKELNDIDGILKKIDYNSVSVSIERQCNKSKDCLRTALYSLEKDEDKI